MISCHRSYNCDNTMNIYKSTAYGFAVGKKVRLGRPGTSLKMGLLGMANIGKSSTFNLLTKLNVPVQNRPFCTIDPNTAFIHIEDPRFEALTKLFNPVKATPPVLRIVDIAGLVKGASEGFGLGNEFLTHVMQVDGLYHVLRAFGGEQIAHTEGSMDPVRDVEIIRNELIIKDKDSIEKKVREFGRKASKSQDKNIRQEHQTIVKAHHCLEKEKKEIRHVDWAEREVEYLNKYGFLTAKPMVYLLNLNKQDYLAGKQPNTAALQDAITFGGKHPATIIPYSVGFEEDPIPGHPSKIDEIIQTGYKQLQLCHFYTVGKDEVRAWAIRTGETAVEAGGKIHSDFTKGFINAEVIHSEVLLKNPSFVQKLQKHCKKEGKKYIVKDGDIVHFNTKFK